MERIGICAEVFIGIKVTVADFIEQKEFTDPVCEVGHIQAGSDPFCGKDGTRFALRAVPMATALMVKLYEFHQVPFDAAQTARHNFEKALNKQIFTFPFYQRKDFHLHRDNLHFFAVGARVFTATEYDRHIQSYSPELFQKTVAGAEKVREALGLLDRPIEVWHDIFQPAYE